MNMWNVEKHDRHFVVLGDQALDAPSHKAPLLHEDQNDVRPTGGTAEVPVVKKAFSKPQLEIVQPL